jgi:hypothetical protein
MKMQNGHSRGNRAIFIVVSQAWLDAGAEAECAGAACNNDGLNQEVIIIFVSLSHRSVFHIVEICLSLA